MEYYFLFITLKTYYKPCFFHFEGFQRHFAAKFVNWCFSFLLMWWTDYWLPSFARTCNLVHMIKLHTINYVCITSRLFLLVWPKYLLSISAQLNKKANHVHSTLFYDWLMSSFGTNFHVCIWRLNSIDTRTNTFCRGVRCKYRCWQVPAGVVTGVNKPNIKFWVDIVRGETSLRLPFQARD